MSQERSAEWLRGAVESHINTCNLITSITSTTTSHPARQGLLAAGKELHNQLDRYRTLLAEAEAREAQQPTAAEVIAACKAWVQRAIDNAEYQTEYDGQTLHMCHYCDRDGDTGAHTQKCDLAQAHVALATIAAWEAARK